MWLAYYTLGEAKLRPSIDSLFTNKHSFSLNYLSTIWHRGRIMLLMLVILSDPWHPLIKSVRAVVKNN